MLTDKQFLRYQRQISLAELGEEGQQKLLNSRVLIVGCGGLGNVVALIWLVQVLDKSLSRMVIAGVTQLTPSDLLSRDTNWSQ